MDKALNYVSLARKAGRVELGEEPVGAAARAQHARLILVASDASEHTWHRAQGFVAHTEQPCIRVPYSKEQLGACVGRSALALAAFTDPALALAFVKALETPDPAAADKLTRQTKRVQQRRSEEKRHQRNKSGMKKS